MAIRRIVGPAALLGAGRGVGRAGPAYADALAVGARGRTRTEAVEAGGAVSLAPLGDDRFLLRAETHDPLCDLLARTPRPPGRGLRVEVDPVTL